MTKYIPYDTKAFPFRQLVEKMIDEPDLTRLRGSPDVGHEGLQSTIWHQRFYRSICDLLPTYHDFIKHIFPLPVVFQRVPTFRVQLPGSVAVHEFHRDLDYGHSPGEVNYFLPFVDTNRFNSVWVETPGGARVPMLCPYGAVVSFDGVNTLHGNVVNESPHSRVSVDFRLVPREAFREGGKTVSGVSLTLGHYWDQMP